MFSYATSIGAHMGVNTVSGWDRAKIRGRTGREHTGRRLYRTLSRPTEFEEAHCANPRPAKFLGPLESLGPLKTLGPLEPLGPLETLGTLELLGPLESLGPLEPLGLLEPKTNPITSASVVPTTPCTHLYLPKENVRQIGCFCFTIVNYTRMMAKAFRSSQRTKRATGKTFLMKMSGYMKVKLNDTMEYLI